MSDSPGDWLERNADRTFARQRTQVETSKLIATFAAGTAAALVAASLQSAPVTLGDWIASFALLAAVAGVLVVIALDRLTEADHGEVLARRQLREWSDEQLVVELRVALMTAVINNNAVVTVVRCATMVQVAIAAIGGVAASVSLLL